MTIRKLRGLACAGLAALAATVAIRTTLACTRILSNDQGTLVLVGRTMDWPTTTEPVLTVLPRGLAHDGGRMGPRMVVRDNPLKWKSSYGSLVTTAYGIGASDGLNERGLSAHLLYLPAAEFGPRDPSRPGLHAELSAQYLLDSAATVTEALALLDKIQVAMTETRGHEATVYLAIEDASGESAIIEYIGGKPVIHHGREFRIMTKDPIYDEHLALLIAHDFSKPTRGTPLPGNVNRRDRFVRATYFLQIMPPPKQQREGVAAMFAIARNVSVPFGAPCKGFGIYNTEYRTVTDHTDKRYFFELTTAPNVIWVDLKKFDLRPGAPVRALHPGNIDLSGDVTARFHKGRGALLTGETT
jgi:choloylglycine hydrolase